MPKKKNALRYAPAAFQGPLDLVEYEHETPDLRLGHIVNVTPCVEKDVLGVTDGTAVILPEHGGDLVHVPPGKWRRILQDFLTTPLGASPTCLPTDAKKPPSATGPDAKKPPSATGPDAKKPLSVTGPDATTFPDVDFYVFASETPCLFVRKPCLGSKVHCVDFEASWHEGTAGSIDKLCEDAGCERPWPTFYVNGALDASVSIPDALPVWRVDLPCTGVLPRAAAQLITAGYIVACCGPTVPPFVRVKSTYLKPTTDAACATTMSTINDAMPGLTAGTDLYTSDLQVHRCMLHWSMLAGCRAAQEQSQVQDLHMKPPCPARHGTEPLQSYLDALAAVKAHRRETGRVDTFSGVEAVLRYNAAVAVTAAQRQQAISLFYWATLQYDVSEETRALLRRALNMYLHFGFVVLRKRAYEFRGKGKKGKDKRNALLGVSTF